MRADSLRFWNMHGGMGEASPESWRREEAAKVHGGDPDPDPACEVANVSGGRVAPKTQ